MYRAIETKTNNLNHNTMDSNLQLGLAKEAGEIKHKNYQGETWLDSYKHHLGMVDEPLPFGRYQMKFNELNRLLDKDPEGKNSSLDARINQLCEEIGC